MELAQVAASGPLVAALIVALLAGLVSFFAPCMLPLVPGYLAYVTGLAGTDLATTSRPRTNPTGDPGTIEAVDGEASGLALATGAWNAFVTWLRVTVGPGQIGI